MKQNNVAKRFGIASLCLATAFSAFSGLVGNVALAEDDQEPAQNTVQTTDFVNVTDTATVAVTEEAAHVTGNKLDKDKTSFTGLRISSDDPYAATFKTVFDGNMQIRFRFPETYTNGLYGDFNFRFTDATDASNYFDITYYVEKESDTKVATAPYIQWGDEIRMSTHSANNAYVWTNEKVSNKDTYQFAPAFLTKASTNYEARGDRMGILELVWVGGILTVKSNTIGNAESNYNADVMIPIASFDGTYDTTQPDNGLIGKQTKDPDTGDVTQDRCGGLPLMNFENGYTVTISSSFEDERTTDKATDVFINSIMCDNTYDFSKTEFTKNAQMTTFENDFEFLPAPTTAPQAGKVFLGYKSTDGKLYGVGSLARKDANLEPLAISYDTINGASVRVDVAGGQSGIRFMTVFNPTEYEAVKGYIQSFGTLIAYTDTLTNGDFTIANYAGGAAFAQVKNTKGTFAYTDKAGNEYVAYSMALVNIQDYTKAYSARGYLVVEYVDGSVATVYTDYNAADNSRSIAEVATLFKTQDAEKYAELTLEEQAIVDAYAAAYVAPNPEA